MYKKIIVVILLLSDKMIRAATVSDSWILFAEALTNSWSNCSVDLELIECLRHRSLEVFDGMITSDIIPLTDDTRLVRKIYRRKISVDNDASRQNIKWKGKDKFTESWAAYVLTKLQNLFHSHTLNIDIIPRSTGRGRHRQRNQMLPMMAFGVTAVGLFMVPMGFQFLAVLAGKALLLSKMALLLASINGLKKVATSGVHYGLYHSNSHQHGHNTWDRGEKDHPRSQT